MTYGVTFDSGLDDSDPILSWHSSKIDLPIPNPCVLYCIKKIENRPELNYCYLTVLVDRAKVPGTGEPYETILFYTYAPVQGHNYSRFIEDIKALVPLHCSRIKDYLVTFHKDQVCPCGWNASNDSSASAGKGDS